MSQQLVEERRAALDKKDNINPSHYKNSTGIECIHALEAALSPEEFIGFLRGNIIKYNWRSRNKGGKEDVEKSIWYANKLVEVLQKIEEQQKEG